MGTFLKYKDLILILLVREVAYKFKGSFLGILWMILIPYINTEEPNLEKI